MENNIATQNNKVAPTGVKGISQFLSQDNVKAKFAEILGQKANGFIASVLSAVSQNDQLKNADQNSVYLSAMIAASLDLPINANLGFAYLVPYRGRDGNQVCQFQMGAKGYKQLALRTGQFKTLNDTDVREGEIVNHNRMTGHIEFEWIQNPEERLSKKIVGYLSYFKLVTGFEHTFYWTVQEIEAHAKKYSQTYKKYGTGLWKDDKDGMSRKTVVKMNLSKNAPMSIELNRATIADQAVIKSYDPSNEDTLDVETEYVDNTHDSIDPAAVGAEKERKRILAYIKECDTTEGLKGLEDKIQPDDEELMIALDDRKRELTAAK